ncbi:MAG: DUF4199 domain-containing protein [Bacteroidia bacterium]|nr:DUF4199 domain-containing protein [Bacteroidota bacterium]MBP9081829.1 DUF4199 domain-containing protein [Bacteroidia bacterium]MBK7387781.1 DUF4199 domain-containing protein [Bacteroidota bacterium]MBK7971153.1 DUF4199 domain-containing protein [Bacteroidota bacterium]MBK8872530.1 DUF4199 domain-containing protein [Bacteroidota bacterium]
MKPLSTSVNESTESNLKSSEIIRIVLPYAFVGGILIILYFLIMRFTGHYQITGLRSLNYLIMIPVIYFAIKAYISKAHDRSYLKGFLSGISTYLISYSLLSLFMILYLAFADPVLMTYLYNSAYPELQLTPVGVGALLIGEGIIAGLITSFLIMQNFKDDIRKAA